MSDLRIRQLIESRLKAWADDNDLPVQLENERFEPPNSHDPRANTYLRGYLLRGTTTSLTLEGTHRAYIGLYQIDVVSASGIGPATADGIALQLASHFPNNLELSAGDFAVKQLTPLRIRSGLSGDTTWTVPTDFQSRADTF
jgi:hypothetical protein